MRPLRPEFPPHVADIVRQLPLDLKRSVKQALRALCSDPGTVAQAGDRVVAEIGFRCRSDLATTVERSITRGGG